VDDEILQRATIYVESREAALKESGDVIAAGKAVAEIGEVIAGHQPARRSADEITLFKSVGVAAEDVAAADLVYQKRTERVSQ
jgi:ornithine cyclodeaminase/alanine dehydrogenase-like protein (mu-crystallin family)